MCNYQLVLCCHLAGNVVGVFRGLKPTVMHGLAL